MYGVDDIRLEEIPVPVPQAGEILLKVKAAAVCGTDVRMIKNGAAGIDENHPRILGHEIAGIIEKTGDGVTGYEKGMRVSVAPNMGCGICDMCVSGNSHLCPDYKALGINLDGGFAEYCIIPAQAVKSGNVCILEEGVTFDDGAVNEPLSCVCNGFERADIRPGDRVLVIGAGPIGIMHCALALMAGAVVYLNGARLIAQIPELRGRPCNIALKYFVAVRLVNIGLRPRNLLLGIVGCKHSETICLKLLVSLAQPVYFRA